MPRGGYAKIGFCRIIILLPEKTFSHIDFACEKRFSHPWFSREEAKLSSQRGKGHRVTIHDLARVAGVSVSTVSKAL
ncbi:LacI family transcriptional regulator, partial [Sinorhizobium medicae]